MINTPPHPCLRDGNETHEIPRGSGLGALPCSTVSETPLTEALIFPHAPGSAVLVEADDCREIEKKLRGEMAKLRNILTECLPFLDARFGNSLRYRAKDILSNKT